MPNHIFCRGARPANAIWSIDDAVQTAAPVVAGSPTVACLLLDRAHCCTLAIAIDDAPNNLGDLTGHLVGIVSMLDRVTAVVLASSVPAGSVPAIELDFIDAHEQFALAGIDLVDWVVFADDVPLSMSEVTDRPSLWRDRSGSAADRHPAAAPPARDS